MKSRKDNDPRPGSEFESLAETIPDIVYRIDKDGKFTYLNGSIRSIGYEPEELIEEHFSKIILPFDTESISRQEVLPLYTGKVTGDDKSPKLFDERRSPARGTTGLKVRLLLKAGTKVGPAVLENLSPASILAEVSGSGLYSNGSDSSKTFIGTIGIIRDLTGQRWMEAELKKYSEHLEDLIKMRTTELEKTNENLYRLLNEYEENKGFTKTVVDNLPTGLYIVQDRQFVFVNSSFTTSIGYKREQLLKRNPLDFIHPEYREQVREKAVLVLKGKLNGPYEYKILDSAGRTRWISETLVPIYYEGRRATLGNFVDITNRKEADRQLTESYEKLKQTLSGVVKVISATIELRDPYTSGHQLKVAQLARDIAGELGLTKEHAGQIYTAALIHDVGKISLPAEILSKPSELNPLEYSLIRMHPQAGFDILNQIEFPFPVARWVLEHHERINGSGYPNGLSKDRISLEARIIAVADVVEAMASRRPYRPELGIEAALGEITQNKGILFDDQVVDACLKLFSDKGFKFD